MAQLSLMVAVTVLLVIQKEVFITLGCKILAKLIHNTGNPYNLVFGNHRLYLI